MIARLTVLIVDDDLGATEVFEPMLRERGFDVRVAHDAAGALAEVDRVELAAILLDYHLPKIDGLELLRRLRTERACFAPAAMITGDFLIDERVARELQTFDAALYFKPLWEEDIVEILGRLLGGRPATHGPRPSTTADGLAASP